MLFVVWRGSLPAMTLVCGSSPPGATTDAAATDELAGGDAAVCLPFDGGPADCPNTPCPPGTICSTETGHAGAPLYYLAWCVSIPQACASNTTCSCMGVCACTHHVGSFPEACAVVNDGGVIACDNGLR